MKDYIVKNCHNSLLSYNEWFLVKANNKKEAIEIVYNNYGYEFHKKDFKAYTLKEMYDDEQIIVIH